LCGRFLQGNYEMIKNLKDVIRDLVFGMEDGLVSNLGLVLGVYVGGGNTYSILLAGLASMFAGAFSMSAGSYLSAKSQREVYEHEIRTIKNELKRRPKKCLSEMSKILHQEGFDQNEIKVMLRHFDEHNKSTFMINYIQKKLGLSEDRFELPFKNALTMFFSFSLGSFFPIAPFFFLTNSSAAVLAVILTIFVLFFVGLIKTRYTKLNWFKSGIEIVVIGIGAGILGYLVGFVLRMFS
jgi:vacuolar iron transporter family protein